VVTQAVTLAREWIVSLLALQMEIPWLQKEKRLELEKALGAAAESIKENSTTSPPIWWHKLPQQRAMAESWGFITELRNDVAHCGMKENPASISSIEKRAQKLPEKLQNLLQGVSDSSIRSHSIVIDVKDIYGDVAKLDKLDAYLDEILEKAGDGKDVVLTGQAPIWLYLKAAHALHGKAKRLYYKSPSADIVTVFDHDPR
jgi:hypothetical protein